MTTTQTGLYFSSLLCLPSLPLVNEPVSSDKVLEDPQVRQQILDILVTSSLKSEPKEIQGDNRVQ